MTDKKKWKQIESTLGRYWIEPGTVEPSDVVPSDSIEEVRNVSGYGVRLEGRSIEPGEWVVFRKASEGIHWLFEQFHHEHDKKPQREVFDMVNKLLDGTDVRFEQDKISTPEQTDVGIVVDRYAGGGDEFAREVHMHPADAAVRAVELAEERSQIE